MNILGKSLDGNLMFAVKQTIGGTVKTQKLLADNIANVNTPGFKRNEIDFKTALKGVIEGNKLELAQTDGQHIPSHNSSRASYRPVVWRNRSESFRNDLNNVDLDQEMEKMAENTIEQQAMVEVLRHTYMKLSTAIASGKT